MSEESNSLEKNGDVSRASHYALQVALQTMKERCVSLHQRLSLVEEENQQLRSKMHNDMKSNLIASTDSERTEVDKLRQQISELSRQNMQLNEHIALISTENDQLWWRLSKMSKDQNYDQKGGSGSTQNLIRSRTFTQHSPNPNLRHKISEVITKQTNELSLEEVMLSPRTGAEPELAEHAEMEPTSDVELATETQRCVDELKTIKLTLAKQNADLTMALFAIKRKMVLQEIESSAMKVPKPETADKSLETDDSITEMKGYFSREIPTAKSNDQLQLGNVDFLEQKRLADDLDKMCPICGQVYNSTISFDDFREHVETHFLDYSDVDASTECNFEFVSHTVGNF